MTSKIRSHIQGKNIEVNKKNGILPQLDFVDLCTDCIKGKQTRQKKKKNNELLELIHIDIYGPFDISS